MIMMKTKIKWGAGVLVLALLSLRACAQTVDVKVKVLDQDGMSVSGVTVDSQSMAHLRKQNVGEALYSKKITDDDGMTSVASIKKSMSERIYISKEGYYRSRSVTLVPVEKNYPPQKPIELTLKEIKNPIAMYAKNFTEGGAGRLSIPDYDGQKYGYDLIIGDWVKPHGKGKVSDIIFRFLGEKSSKPYGARESYDEKILISFSNPEDGILEYRGLSEAGWRYGSDFVSSYEAPLKGYQANWEQRTWGGKDKFHKSTRDIDRNFYFRVRTKVDSKGNIISAHYGKIYGDFMSFIYYVNPTSKDRNVEFDPKKNLFKNENVTRP